MAVAAVRVAVSPGHMPGLAGVTVTVGVAVTVTTCVLTDLLLLQSAALVPVTT